VFRCISVVVEGACVRDFRMLKLCAIVIVGLSADGKCVGRRGSVVTGWRWIGRGGEDRGKSG
jgi:hypothetical protein